MVNYTEFLPSRYARMHTVWRIQELVDRIVMFRTPYLDIPPWLPNSREGLADVCALAQTCRILQEPALDVLWYRQYHFVELLKCLPADLWRVKEPSGRDHSPRTRKRHRLDPDNFVSTSLDATIVGLHVVHDVCSISQDQEQSVRRTGIALISTLGASANSGLSWI